MHKYDLQSSSIRGKDFYKNMQKVYLVSGEYNVGLGPWFWEQLTLGERKKKSV